MTGRYPPYMYAFYARFIYTPCMYACEPCYTGMNAFALVNLMRLKRDLPYAYVLYVYIHSQQVLGGDASQHRECGGLRTQNRPMPPVWTAEPGTGLLLLNTRNPRAGCMGATL
jgi:hypothetical protein